MVERGRYSRVGYFSIRELRRVRLHKGAFLAEANLIIYYIFLVPVNVGAKMGVLILKLQQNRMSGSLVMRANCTKWKALRLMV